jgi:hypothetical protein
MDSTAVVIMLLGLPRATARYQLTALGGAAPNLHVAEEIENRFKIAGGEERMKICWQVTGSRKDPWAAANPFEVEREKREEVLAPVAEAVEEQQRAPEPSGIDFVRLEEENGRRMNELLRPVEGPELEEFRRGMEREELLTADVVTADGNSSQPVRSLVSWSTNRSPLREAPGFPSGRGECRSSVPWACASAAASRRWLGQGWVTTTSCGRFARG